MEPTENNIPNEDQFDTLLRHALLNKEILFNEKNTETMATHTLSPSAEEASVPENNIVSRLTKDLAPKKFNWKLNLLVLAGILSIATVVYFFRMKDPVQILSHNDSMNKAMLLAMKTNTISRAEVLLTSNPLPVTNPAIFTLNDSTDNQATTIDPPQHGEQHYVYTGLNIPNDMLHYEDVPTLTDDQITQTATDKSKMMKDIARKKSYGNLRPGKTLVDGKMVSLDGFSIKNAEVTNLEYRTFLNDLLVQGKFDDYLLAAPVKGLWKAAGIPEFEDIYSTNSKYNDFPAVGMPRKGAELFCDWLTTSMKTAITLKQVKWSGDAMPDFRLPSNAEWIYAARGCDSTAMKFPWGHYVPDSVMNKNGCFLCDFNYTSSKDVFAGHHICDGYQKLKQGGFHHTTITTAGLAIDTLLTCPVYSYNPNETGQYNMLGDVSEMVWTYDPANPSVKGAARSLGGNWNSYVDNVQIEAAEQYLSIIEASAMIGFRPVMNGHYNYAMIKQVKI